MKLYKYHRINEFLIESLRSKQNWYSRIEYLNDPFELFFNDQTGSDVYKLFKKTICVCSFSKNRNNILMWSHYAENHTGVCLEFEFDENSNDGSNFIIDYNDEILKLEDVERNSSGHLNLNVKTNGKFLIQKFKTWNYEEEIRKIRLIEDFSLKGSYGEFPYELKAIYFGKNSNHENIELIKSVTKNYKDLMFYKVDLELDTMKMDVLKVI